MLGLWSGSTVCPVVKCTSFGAQILHFGCFFSSSLLILLWFKLCSSFRVNSTALFSVLLVVSSSEYETSFHLLSRLLLSVDFIFYLLFLCLYQLLLIWYLLCFYGYWCYLHHMYSSCNYIVDYCITRTYSWVMFGFFHSNYFFAALYMLYSHC